MRRRKSPRLLRRKTKINQLLLLLLLLLNASVVGGTSSQERTLQQRRSQLGIRLKPHPLQASGMRLLGMPRAVRLPEPLPVLVCGMPPLERLLPGRPHPLPRERGIVGMPHLSGGKPPRWMEEVKLQAMRVGQRHHTLNVGPRWVTLLQRHPHHTGPNVAHVGTRHLPVSDWEEPVHLSWEPHPPLAHRQWGAPQTLPWQLQLEPWLCRCKHRHLVIWVP